MAVAERLRGAACLAESANRGHTEAVAFAQREALGRGAARFLTIPGDVPVRDGRGDRALVRRADEAPAWPSCRRCSGFGTNAALLAPPDAMPLKFGEPSFDNHLLRRARSAASLRVVLRAARASVSTSTRPTTCPLLLARGAHTRSAAPPARSLAAARLGAPTRHARRATR